MALETNRKTLRNDRAVASASQSLSDQQNLENGETYSEDENGVGTWTAPADRYNDATITVPESLQPDASRDPESAELRIGAEQFDGTVNLNNAFGSMIGNGDGEEVHFTDLTYFLQIDPYYVNYWMRKHGTGKWINGRNELWWKWKEDTHRKP